ERIAGFPGDGGCLSDSRYGGGGGGAWKGPWGGGGGRGFCAGGVGVFAGAGGGGAAALRPARATAICRATRGPRTETTSRTPVTTIWDWAETLARLITFCRAPSRKTPATAPPRVPLPPSKSTPPRRTAATTESSRPVALS